MLCKLLKNDVIMPAKSSEDIRRSSETLSRRVADASPGSGTNLNTHTSPFLPDYPQESASSSPTNRLTEHRTL